MELDKNNVIELYQADNGYIIKRSYIDDYEEGNPIYKDDVQLIESNDYDDKETFVRLIEYLAESLGFHYDKYGKENLNITWDKLGHKVD